MKENRERKIEDAVINRPEILGFAGATAIRNVRVGSTFGLVDVMLLPRSGRVKLALVEAKHATAPDASSKVIGQLLMYYAGALDIGAAGLERLRSYAVLHREMALSSTWISPKEITGGVSPAPAAWEVIEAGDKLRPEEIGLFIALNNPPHNALRIAVEKLHQHHGLSIGIIVVQDGKPTTL